MVETTERKADLLQVLNAVAAHPAGSIEIRTVAEAAVQSSQIAPAERNVLVPEAPVAQQAISVEANCGKALSSEMPAD